MQIVNNNPTMSKRAATDSSDIPEIARKTEVILKTLDRAFD